MFEAKGKENIAGLLLSLSDIEERAFLLFLKLAEQTESSTIKQNLLEISNDCKRHSAIFKRISDETGLVKIKKQKFEKMFDSISSAIKKVSSEIEEKEQIKNEDLLKIILILESSAIEEQFMQIQTKTFQLMASKISKLYNVNFEEHQELFKGTSSDEENHMVLLKNIRDELEKLLEKSDDKFNVKYQQFFA